MTTARAEIQSRSHDDKAKNAQERGNTKKIRIARLLRIIEPENRGPNGRKTPRAHHALISIAAIRSRMREMSAQTMARPRKTRETIPAFEQPKCQRLPRHPERSAAQSKDPVMRP